MNLNLVRNELYESEARLINSISKYETPVGTIPLKVMLVTGKPLINNEMGVNSIGKFSGTGVDFWNYEVAEIKAIGEFVERYSSTVISQNLIEGTYENLKKTYKNLLDPMTITRIRNEEYINQKNIPPKSLEDSNFFWVEGFDELTLQKKWIPTDLVYLLPNLTNKYAIREIISTGLAAGETLKDAKIRGLLECIERDSIVIMWQNMIYYPIIKLSTINNLVIQQKIRELEDLDLQVIILDISTDLEVPVYFCILKNDDKAPFISVGASANFSEENAVLNALMEACLAYNVNCFRLMNNIKFEFSGDIDKLKFSNMDDHSSLYADNNLNEKLNFLQNGDEIDFITNDNRTKDYNGLLSKLKSLNLDYCTVDLTTKDIKNSDLHVVRSIVPQLAFLEYNTPHLECSRIKDVPKKLGYKVNNEYNSLPHPFP